MSAFDVAYDDLLGRWGVPVEQLEVRGEFGTTHVNACGPLDGPPVVLLAGHGATSAVWFTVAPRLAATHRVYAVDLLGDAGRSVIDSGSGTASGSGRGGAPPRSVVELMSWLTGVLDGLGLDRVTVCGHSYGAWIGLTYALASPERVDRIALIDPTDCFLGLRAGYVARALPMLLRPSVRRFEAFLRWEVGGVQVEPAWIRLAALGTLEDTARPVRPRRPTADALRGLQADLQVVVAGRTRAHDPRKLADAAAEYGADVVWIDDATHHSLPAAHTDELLPVLLKHLG
ncbi:alpha/beta fold hydrolase [Kribbella amoyensis]|uniref:alpha/beta fold hydrolase n=1 Tax=Kribbella amoyensis TaxID=996641 RepID=UPI00192DC10C|nr:alpha/beta hydrolase [Kribbella amoyensis]